MSMDYDVLQKYFDEMQESQRRIESKLDSFIQRVIVLETHDTHSRVDKLDDRLQKVEQKLYWYAGLAAGVGAVGGHLIRKVMGG